MLTGLKLNTAPPPLEALLGWYSNSNGLARSALLGSSDLLSLSPRLRDS